jgi:hypothetical protein
MQDQDWNIETDQDAASDDRRLEHSAQLPSDLQAFRVALMQALSYSSIPQVEAA